MFAQCLALVSMTEDPRLTYRMAGSGSALADASFLAPGEVPLVGHPHSPPTPFLDTETENPDGHRVDKHMLIPFTCLLPLHQRAFYRMFHPSHCVGRLCSVCI